MPWVQKGFRLSNSTRTSSRKYTSIRLDVRVGLLTTSKNVVDSTECASRVAQSKTFLSLWHRSSHHKNTHAHTTMPGSTQYPTTASTPAWLLSLLWILAASQRGTLLLAPPNSSVYHTMAAARGIDHISPTTFMLLGREFVAREARVPREERTKHRASNRFRLP